MAGDLGVYVRDGIIGGAAAGTAVTACFVLFPRVGLGMTLVFASVALVHYAIRVAALGWATATGQVQQVQEIQQITEADAKAAMAASGTMALSISSAQLKQEEKQEEQEKEKEDKQKGGQEKHKKHKKTRKSEMPVRHTLLLMAAQETTQQEKKEEASATGPQAPPTEQGTQEDDLFSDTQCTIGSQLALATTAEHHHKHHHKGHKHSNTVGTYTPKKYRNDKNDDDAVGRPRCLSSPVGAMVKGVLVEPVRPQRAGESPVLPESGCGEE
eukprot:TRINITY_DN3951_c0_g1_i3.p1 TRINITY_DN3951_c0_g1~~TRINITY_DN3951_c0_g1_i3.p1  ORF type:complete len:270 (-),score=80.50 TRINITY_DN3951_c0_g1_i3:24-833(-)